jgi:hypothetical protein
VQRAGRGPVGAGVPLAALNAGSGKAVAQTSWGSRPEPRRRRDGTGRVGAGFGSIHPGAGPAPRIPTVGRP